MKIETLPIEPQAPYCSLVMYRHEENVPSVGPRRAIIVCPGGGYIGLSGREDEIVALQYAAAGFQAFVLHYGVGRNAANHVPLLQACHAIRYLREHAAELYIRPDRIFITGFSAGGHLSASAGTMYRHPVVQESFLKQYGDDRTLLARPDGMILCYPLITTGPYSHRASIITLCGGAEPTPEQELDYSPDRHVSDETPPAFLWHTADDGAVPVQNSLLFAAALAEHRIPFEAHIYPHGVHGLSLCDTRTWCENPDFLAPDVAPWIHLAIRWAQKL